MFNNRQLAVALGGLAIFFVLASSFHLFAGHDGRIASFFSENRSPLADELMAMIDLLLHPFFLAFYSLGMVLFLAFRKRKQDIFLTVSSLTGIMASVYLSKEIIARARPIDILQSAAGYSLPSGHAATNLVFFGLVYYLFKDRFNAKALAVLCLFFILLAGLNRLYLGVHWTSDILAGYALGLFWLYLPRAITRDR